MNLKTIPLGVIGLVLAVAGAIAADGSSSVPPYSIFVTASANRLHFAYTTRTKAPTSRGCVENIAEVAAAVRRRLAWETHPPATVLSMSTPPHCFEDVNCWDITSQ